jgi:phage terminase large subunit-like protein
MGGTFVVWPGGAEARLFGAYGPEDVERLRAGGNRCWAWLEELAAWPKLDDCYDHLNFGLRLGPHPRAVASTTPKPRTLIKALVADTAHVAVTRATTADNPYLAERVRARYYERYAGTRLGRQELGGELIDDIDGALWRYEMIVRAPAPPDLARVVVAVDPSGGSDPENDEQGIVVCGLGADGRGYVLADRSCRLSPDGWGRRAVQAYVDLKADAIVGEANYGGDMVQAVIRTAASAMGVTGVTYKAVHASRGKAVRAQPVAALYEQGRVSHCDVYPELEDELTQWTPESGRSPNRLDALVWALSELMVKDARAVYVY